MKFLLIENFKLNDCEIGLTWDSSLRPIAKNVLNFKFKGLISKFRLVKFFIGFSHT